MQKLRILFLGDEQVGKTSIIRCFVTQSFPTEVPTCNPPVSIPPELSSSQASLTIIDSYCNKDLDRKGQDSEYLQKEIKKANIIILVFDITRPETLKRTTIFWLPLIASNGRVPCVLVGNKIDLPKSSQNLEEMGKDIMFQFPFCQIMIETTAKSYGSIAKLFEISEQAVLFPTSVLYNPLTYELSEDFIRALKLIFRLCDHDGDMHLNTDELCAFNKSVFNVNLSSREIEKLKLLIHEAVSDGIDHMGITLSGFIAINKVFITKLKSNNSWMILQHFNFDQNLEKKTSAKVFNQESSVVELSPSAIEFLCMMFKRYASHDLLTQFGIEEICSTMKLKPWHPDKYEEMVPCVDNGITVYSWIALWHLMMYKDSQSTLNSLELLGYQPPIEAAYASFLKSDLQHRKVHLCSVLGFQNVGKKQLIRKFLNKPPKEKVMSTVCGTIEEIEEVNNSTFLIVTKLEVEAPDVACMVYDGSSLSMNFIKKLNVPITVPRILLLNKNDSIDHESAYSFALELGLKECPQFNLKTQRPSTLFRQLKEYAIHPSRGFIRRGKIKNKPKKNNSFGWIVAGVGIATFAIFIGKKLSISKTSAN